MAAILDIPAIIKKTAEQANIPLRTVKRVGNNDVHVITASGRQWTVLGWGMDEYKVASGFLWWYFCSDEE